MAKAKQGPMIKVVVKALALVTQRGFLGKYYGANVLSILLRRVIVMTGKAAKFKNI